MNYDPDVMKAVALIDDLAKAGANIPPHVVKARDAYRHVCDAIERAKADANPQRLAREVVQMVTDRPDIDLLDAPILARANLATLVHRYQPTIEAAAGYAIVSALVDASPTIRANLGKVFNRQVARLRAAIDALPGIDPDAVGAAQRAVDGGGDSAARYLELVGAKKDAQQVVSLLNRLRSQVSGLYPALTDTTRVYACWAGDLTPDIGQLRRAGITAGVTPFDVMTRTDATPAILTPKEHAAWEAAFKASDAAESAPNRRVSVR